MDQGNYAVSTLNHYLKGTNFPAQQEEMAANAEGNGAPSDLVSHKECGHRKLRQPRGGYASAPVPAGRRVNRPLPPVRSVGVLLAGYVPEDGLIFRGAAQRQLQMLPAQPLRPAPHIAARVDGSVARHEVAARREVRGRLAARPPRILKPAAPDPLVALDGGHDLCRVSQDIGV